MIHVVYLSRLSRLSWPYCLSEGTGRSRSAGAQVLLECSRRRAVSVHLHVSTIEDYGELATSRLLHRGEPAERQDALQRVESG